MSMVSLGAWWVACHSLMILPGGVIDDDLLGLYLRLQPLRLPISTSAIFEHPPFPTASPTNVDRAAVVTRTTLPAYSENALDQSLNEFGTRTSLSNNSIPPRSPFAPATGGSSYSQASTSASSGPNAQQIIDPELPDFSLDIESFDLDLLLDSPQATLSQRSASCDGESLSSSDISAGLERSPLDLKKLMSPIYSGTPQAPNQQGPRLNSGSRKRRFPCTRHSCTRAFTSRNDLERHLKTKKHRNDATHSGDAVGLLRCKVPWCKRGKEGWARKDHYMRHMERMHPDLKLEDGEDSSSE
ncbi:hypothetical protein BU26DRAFT_555056 [Trematosphaeria pertusa]|uniref:C2H2-type domain-containing protein n=1 Tax=Trematosphaeria pertusa TaxID=390896 RepID=A0A6A6HYW2_9PLEO|nr:uncharacterized protein BU26DRAFT_555056 [Trematosphaeria pertusa]KAF2242892.1 hypothetical protein BU26DRAFT_555056 [Trematosphaeria pertusa]